MRSGLAASLVYAIFVGLDHGVAFQIATSFQPPNRAGRSSVTRTVLDAAATGGADDPQVFATGYSANPDLHVALQQATDAALAALPPLDQATSGPDGAGIDLAFVTVSSLYSASPATVVPAVLSSASVYGGGIDKLLGCTSGGIISSAVNVGGAATEGSGEEAADGGTSPPTMKECLPIETEALPGVSVTLALLPGVDVRTFHVLSDALPDDAKGTSYSDWNDAVGLQGYGAPVGAKREDNDDNSDDDDPVFLLLSAPAFQTDLDDLLEGMSIHHPTATVLGGSASTVSSLSRATLYQFDSSEPSITGALGDGCLGAALTGDIEVKTLLAQGAKPVGGVYRVVTGKESTVSAIMLDEAATLEDVEAEEALADDVDEDEMDAKAKAKAAYAKAAIPKPVLAEANYLMKTLSDDDQAFMRKNILVGLERGGSMVKTQTPGELSRLARGEGHRFAVNQVASAGMKDGSVTLPLGSVDVEKGTRFRFFVRDGDFAKKEVDALWTGYRKTSQGDGQGGDDAMNPTACMVVSTLDRGTKLFGGKPGYESDKVSEYLPMTPSILGLYANGVLGKLDLSSRNAGDTMLHGSGTCYAIFKSKSNRPIYSARKVADNTSAADANGEGGELDEKLAERVSKTLSAFHPSNDAAPRTDDGELVLRRREIHSGRAISVSTVEWSVAENMAKPTSALEGYMWDKEAEVDRFRERVPLANLLTQVNLSNLDPSKPKPRDFIGPVKKAGEDGSFVIVPECKRMEPTIGSIRKRYDVSKIVGDFAKLTAPAISVNCDPVLFGGELDDITTARAAVGNALQSNASDDGDEGAVVPILASDLILYPYQLYKLRLAGADAVNLVAGALQRKDLLYLTKIAQSMQMQTIVSVNSEVQIDAVASLSPGSFDGISVSNRELEDFSFDETGEQALSLLKSAALEKFLALHDVPVFVEGRVGIIERDGTAANYIAELKKAGAFGAFVGGSLADNTYTTLLEEASSIVSK